MASSGKVPKETVYYPEDERGPSPRDDVLDLDEIFACAYVVARRGELKRAHFLADRLSREDPEYPGVWAFKAWLCMRLGYEEEAEACRKRASGDRVPKRLVTP